ncbi:HD domain-containing protein [Candidatus Saccharibacteria bacterium]|nr:HD domain-containing protein [Candidatus Saccharibacteria bacterium]
MSSVEQISAKVRKYIETRILPQYEKLSGHAGGHIEQVIDRSLEFAKQAPGVNLDMVYIIAAYHDLGRLIDNETHNIESAKMMRANKFLLENFTAEEVETMAEAVEDHRASLGHEPRSIYGKIVSSADRNPTVESMLERAYDYNKLLHPDYSEDEIIEDVRVHIREKYSPDGYAAKTMYFKDPSFEKMLVKVEEITRTPESFAKVQKVFNRKRFGK